MIRSLFFFIAVVFCSSNSIASSNYTIHQHYVAPRALGMGNTFMGIDDYNAIFYNPAAMARMEENELNLAVQAAISPDALDFGSDLSDAAEAGDDATKATNVSNVLKASYGNAYSMRFPTLKGIWTRKTWGVAVIPADLSFTLMPRKLAGPSLEVKSFLDTTIAYAYSSAPSKYFSWGAVAKFINRASVDKALSIADLVAGGGDPVQSDDFEEGFTIDADVAVQYIQPIPTQGFLKWMKYAKPTYGLVIRNIADYGFGSSLDIFDGVTGEPDKLQRRIDLGIRWDLPKFWVFTPRFMTETRDILHDYYNFQKGLHLGAELGWKMGSWLNGSYQIGLSQGYITYGVGVELGWFRLDAASFAEEVGTSDAKQNDRQYIVQMSLDF